MPEKFYSGTLLYRAAAMRKSQPGSLFNHFLLPLSSQMIRNCKTLKISLPNLLLNNFTPSHQSVGESGQCSRNVSLPAGRQAKILSSEHPCPILDGFPGRVIHYRHFWKGAEICLIERGEQFFRAFIYENLGWQNREDKCGRMIQLWKCLPCCCIKFCAQIHQAFGDQGATLKSMSSARLIKG
jgi:hypothetical protein